ncbi:MAG: hypothetical protein WC829_02715 [Hyphomicrobium sp.]|jgi:hypothetical protein
MRYDPTTKQDRPKMTPGTYSFVIDAASEFVSKNGNDGLKLELSVAAHPDRDIRVFDNLMYMPSWLFKVEHLLTGIGLDFLSPPPVEELVGKRGSAEFVIDKESGFLKVKDYVPGDRDPGLAGKNEAPF